MSPSVDLHELSAGKSLRFVAEIIPRSAFYSSKVCVCFFLLLFFTHVMIRRFGVAG